MERRQGVVIEEKPLRVEWEDGERETLKPSLFDDPLVAGERFWVVGVWGNVGLVRVVDYGLDGYRADNPHQVWPEIDIG